MTATADRPYPAAAYGYYVVAALVVTSLISALDRQVLTLLVSHMHRDLGLSDSQIGLLQGLSFALLYGFAALPAGYLADRNNRRNVLLGGLILWSGMTVLCGFASTFNQLFLARMGVGLGEACLGPACVSILSDYFAPARRGRVLGVFQMGTYFGGGASVILGATVLAIFKDAYTVTLPVLGAIATWKVVFLAVGAIGLVFAPVLLTVREPQRRERLIAAPAGTSGLASGLAAMRGVFAGRALSVILVYAVYATVVFVGFGLTAWAPTYFVREFAMAPSQAGFLVGVTTAVCGLTGCFLSGWLSDRWTRRGLRGEKLRVTLVGWTILIPAVLTMTLTHQLNLAWAMLAFGLFANAVLVASAPAAISDMLPNELRGMGVSVYYINQALFGLTLGPLAVAVVNDQVFAGQDLRAAMLWTLGPASLIGLLVAVSAQGGYQRLRDTVTARTVG